jgi:predicted small secreted protein
MFKKIVTRLMAALFIAGSFATLAACNTIEGAGKDIERGGAAIKNEANEKK